MAKSTALAPVRGSASDSPTEKALAAIKSRLITHDQSMKLVKNLFRVAFSTIAHMRGFFDDSCYKNKKYGEHVYKVVRKGNDPNAARYIDWLEKGVFQALHLGYLSDVLLEIYHPTDYPHLHHTFPSQLPSSSSYTSSSSSSSSHSSRKKLIELYAFSIVYGNSKLHMSLADADVDNQDRDTDSNTKDATKPDATSRYQLKNIVNSSTDLLHSIRRMTRSLIPLPEKHLISIRLLYTSNTPPTYEPPLFQPACDTFGLDWFECSHVPSLPTGYVSTPYHDMKVDLFTSVDRKLLLDDLTSSDPAARTAKSNPSTASSVINGTLLESEMYGVDSIDVDTKKEDVEANISFENGPDPDPENESINGCDESSGDSKSTDIDIDDDLSDIAPLSLSFSDRISMARKKKEESEKEEELKQNTHMDVDLNMNRNRDDHDMLFNDFAPLKKRGSGESQQMETGDQKKKMEKKEKKEKKNGKEKRKRMDRGKEDDAQGEEQKKKRRKNSTAKEPCIEYNSF